VAKVRTRHKEKGGVPPFNKGGLGGIWGKALSPKIEMKKHRFKQLDTVLRHRKLLEDQKKVALAEVARIHQRELAQLESIRKSRNKYAEELWERQKNGVSINEVLLYIPYLKSLEQREQAQMEITDKASQKEALARQELIEASKQYKIIEKLKDNLQQEYEEELRIAERKFLDEIATNRFILNR